MSIDSPGRYDRLAILLFVSLATVGPASAATFCVTDGDINGLQAALATAASNSEDDVVRLQTGQYLMGANFLLDYGPTNEHYNLSIEGGYINSVGGPCTPPGTAPDARDTVLDGGLLRLRLAAGAGSLELKSLTVQNTFSNDASHPPVEIVADANATGDITVQNSIFDGNASINTPGVYFLSGSGALFVENSVFTRNTSFAGQSAVNLGSNRISSTLIGAIIVNSTFTANASTVAAVRVYAPMCHAVAANDIFWGNPAGDVFFDNPTATYLLNDDFADLAESANTQAQSLLSLDPLFKPDFSLSDPSPLRDKGNRGGFIFSPGPFDVSGNPRIWGAEPDIGAYEVQDLFFNGFEL